MSWSTLTNSRLTLSAQRAEAVTGPILFVRISYKRLVGSERSKNALFSVTSVEATIRLPKGPNNLGAQAHPAFGRGLRRTVRQHQTMRFQRLNAITSPGDRRNHSPSPRLSLNLLCQYASTPQGSSVSML